MCSPQSVIDEIGRESRCGSERRQETGPVGGTPATGLDGVNWTGGDWACVPGTGHQADCAGLRAGGGGVHPLGAQAGIGQARAYERCRVGSISARNEKERRKKKRKPGSREHVENRVCAHVWVTQLFPIDICMGADGFFLQTRQSHWGGQISWFTIFTLTCSGSPPPDTHTHRPSRPLSVFGSTGLLRIVVSH